eukprot:6648683-Alexandrium_andersonii.AAC.1
MCVRARYACITRALRAHYASIKRTFQNTIGTRQTDVRRSRTSFNMLADSGICSDELGGRALSARLGHGPPVVHA